MYYKYNGAMKYLSLLLVSTLLFCYTGICYALYTTGTLNITKTNCHTSHQDRASNTDANIHSYNDPDSGKGQGSMCQDALLSAHNSYDLNLKDTLSYSLVANIPSLETDKVFNPPSIFEIKKQYRPPDLFLLNSSLLL